MCTMFKIKRFECSRGSPVVLKNMDVRSNLTSVFRCTQKISEHLSQRSWLDNKPGIEIKLCYKAKRTNLVNKQKKMSRYQIKSSAFKRNMMRRKMTAISWHITGVYYASETRETWSLEIFSQF